METTHSVLPRIFRVVVGFNKRCLSSIYLILSQEPIYILSERWLIHLRGSYSRPVWAEHWTHIHYYLTAFSNQTEIINNSLSKFHFSHRNGTHMKKKFNFNSQTDRALAWNNTIIYTCTHVYNIQTPPPTIYTLIKVFRLHEI